jgi:hypothetical protein
MRDAKLHERSHKHACSLRSSRAEDPSRALHAEDPSRDLDAIFVARNVIFLTHSRSKNDHE